MNLEAGSASAVIELRTCLTALLAPVVEGQTVILTGSVATNTSLRDFFNGCGASCVYPIPLPTDEGSPINLRLSSIENFFAQPDAPFCATLGNIDPKGNAVVYAGSFTAQSSLCGRRIIGGRRREHLEAERKDQQADYLNDLDNVERTILDISDRAEAARRIRTRASEGAVVVSGIPDDFVATGSSHTYIVPSNDGTSSLVPITRMLEAMRGDCQRIVLSNLDRGVPCTYYGFVSSKWVIDFGPFEALVYWDRETYKLSAPGIVRPLNVKAAQSFSARSTVESIARLLYERTKYTGAFCTDGALQSTYYVVHEINPRVCAGFSLLGELCPGSLPLMLVDLALRIDPNSAEILQQPLSALSPWLEVQQPLVKLWDKELKPLEAKLRASAAELDVDTWLLTVRQSLVGQNTLPIADVT